MVAHVTWCEFEAEANLSPGADTVRLCCSPNGNGARAHDDDSLLRLI